MKYRRLLQTLVIVALLSLPLAFPIEAFTTESKNGSPANHSSRTYYIEISIAQRTLWLYEKGADGELVEVAEYPVGTAVRGLETYPLGPGKVTAIYFDPWWHPTPYSREVFRKRGIELPNKVPPGHPLNYMGPFKIALSHKTWKGAIYRIHGNNDPKRVGRRVTGGCFVMNNDQGLDLARKLRVGTEVNILP